MPSVVRRQYLSNMEEFLVPIIAAFSAVDSITKLAGGAVSAWKPKTSSKSAEGGVSTTPGSFHSLLQASSADVSKQFKNVVSTITSAAASGK